jgi:hypothetical protein
VVKGAIMNYIEFQLVAGNEILIYHIPKQVTEDTFYDRLEGYGSLLDWKLFSISVNEGRHMMCTYQNSVNGQLFTTKCDVYEVQS